MDVTVMEPFSAIEAPQLAIQLFNRTIDHNSHIKTFRSKKIRITRQGDGAVHCDGDPFVTGNIIEVEIVNKGFNVVVNPDTHTHRESLLQIFADHFNEFSARQQDLLRRNSSNIKELNKAWLEKIKKL